MIQQCILMIETVYIFMSNLAQLYIHVKLSTSQDLSQHPFFVGDFYTCD